MKYKVVHKTQYDYEQAVTHGYNLAHFSPRSFHRQVCVSSSITVEPVAEMMRTQEDFFGNTMTYFAVQQPHNSLIVTSCSDVDIIAEQHLPESLNAISWEQARDGILASTAIEDIEARQYSLESPYVKLSPDIKQYAAKSFTANRPLLEAVNDLMQRIHHEFTYDPDFTTLATPLTDVLAHRRGVCQDFAHLAIACIISHGMPTRYVSGYIETLPPPGQQKLQGADASHAWFSVMFPGYGWLDFDPTNNQIPMDKHITTAWGRDYSDVTPLKGVIFGGGKKNTLQVSVDVTALKKD